MGLRSHATRHAGRCDLGVTPRPPRVRDAQPPHTARTHGACTSPQPDRSRLQPWRFVLVARSQWTAAAAKLRRPLRRRLQCAPIYHYELMQARVVHLHRDAEHHRLAQAASRARRPRHQSGRHPVAGHPAAVFVRRALAAQGTRSLRPSAHDAEGRAMSRDSLSRRSLPPCGSPPAGGRAGACGLSFDDKPSWLRAATIRRGMPRGRSPVAGAVRGGRYRGDVETVASGWAPGVIYAGPTGRLRGREAVMDRYRRTRGVVSRPAPARRPGCRGQRLATAGGDADRDQHRPAASARWPHPARDRETHRAAIHGDLPGPNGQAEYYRVFLDQLELVRQPGLMPAPSWSWVR